MELKDKFIHRDLSWLNFNKRVLEEAGDERNPIIERLKFLSICTTNLDEFFMVRYSGAKKLLDSGYNRKDQFGYYPQEVVAQLKARTVALIHDQYQLFTTTIKPSHTSNSIILVRGAV